jgi:hypothetical protein
MELLLELRTRKSLKKTARTEEKTALKPITVGSLPETLEFDEDNLPKLPIY